MAYANDIKYIRDKLSAFCSEHYEKLRNEGVDPVVTCKIQTHKGKQNIDSLCNLTEIPDFFLDLLSENNKLIMEVNETKLIKMKEEYDLEINEKDSRIQELESQLVTKSDELDALAQYNRRDNIRIEGVEYSKGENVNSIILEIANAMGMEEADLKESDISTGHRIGNIKELSENVPIGLASNENKKPPSLIFRFARRDPKIKFFENRKNLISNPKCPAKFRNISIYEDVTPLRSRIMYELRNRGDRKEFKYVWSRGGRIYCLRPEEVAQPGHQGKRQKPTIINTPEDLKKVGFSETEIKEIRLMKRK